MEKKSEKVKGSDEYLFKKFNNEAEVRNRCVFTTHTPVPAGHDRFEFDLVRNVLGSYFREELIDWGGEYGKLNMTKLAIHFSRFINAVSKKHGEVTQKIFLKQFFQYWI